jgi:hypothetical protein
VLLRGRERRMTGPITRAPEPGARLRRIHSGLQNPEPRPPPRSRPCGRLHAGRMARQCAQSLAARPRAHFFFLRNSHAPQMAPAAMSAYSQTSRPMICVSSPAVRLWCGRRGSNPHGKSRGILSPLRLPVSPRPRRLSNIVGAGRAQAADAGSQAQGSRRRGWPRPSA